MRITVTPPSGSGSTVPFLLADDTSSTAMLITSMSNPNGVGGPVTGDSGFLPDLSFVTQSEELIGATYKSELPRGNLQTTWTFTVNRQATSFDAMIAFCADHPALVPPTGTVALYVANTVRYLKNAVCGGVRCTKQKGTDIEFSYVFRGSFVPPVTGAAGTGTGGPWTPS